MIMSLVASLYFRGIKTDLSKTFPPDYWPAVRGVGSTVCSDLSGTYQVTTTPENKFETDAVAFPPGMNTLDGSTFEVSQTGCNTITIDYINRFDSPREYIIDRVNNDLMWNSATGLFCYKVTDFEPDGFSGTTIFNNDQACVGIGTDHSFLTDYKMDRKGRLGFITFEFVGNQKYRFKQLN